MTDLKRKVRVRAGHKGYVTKTITDARALISSGDQADLKKLKSLQSILRDKLAEIKGLDREIADETKEECIDQEVADSCEFASAVYECIADIEALCGEKEKSANESQASGAGSIPSQLVTPAIGSAPTKLPKLELKKFYGNPVEWAPFWDSFNSAVHQNSSISDVNKFNYLKSLIQGQAANTISGFSLTGENYKEAVRLLKERYGNKQVLISAHMEALLKLPAASSISETKKLRDIYDKLESHVRSLQNIGIGAETYGSFLSPVVMSKIPEDLRVTITRNLTSEEWNLEPMLEIFRKELQLREKCQFFPGSVNSREPRAPNPPVRGEPFGSPPTTSALFTNGNTQSRQGPWCTYCRGQHPSSNCTVVTNVAARKQFIRQKGKCFKCLRSGHLASQCSNGKNCHLCGFKGHHPSICEAQKSDGSISKWNAGREGDQGNQNSPVQAPTTSMFINVKNGVLLQTARANIFNPAGHDVSVNARLIFDSGSQRSYITEGLQKALNLPVSGRDTLMIKTFGESTPKLRHCDIVQLAVGTTDGMTIYVTAYVVPLICTPVSNQMIEFTQASYPHLQCLELADNTQGTDELDIDLLIGADFYWHFVNGITIRGPEPGPVALSTRLGYVLSGPVNIPVPCQQDSTVNLTETHVLEISTSVCDEKISLDQQVKQFWDLETLGIKENEPTVYEKFITDIRHDGERYEVKLPFKEFHPVLPDNYQLSKGRLGSLLQRLKSKPQVLKHYDEIIREQLRNNIIEAVTSETELDAGKVHYLPHREVIRMDKETTKIRVVYDASAKRNGPSLNDCLYSGPPLNPLIFEVLARFRAHKVALTADIEKAFLNVGIAPEHRNYLRFLWIDDILTDNPQLVVMRFARVVFGVNSSPFLLNATIRHHLSFYSSSDPDFVEDVVRSLYVDDLASSRPNGASAYEFYLKLKFRFKEAGFNMRKWLTNDQNLASRIQCEEGQSELHPATELQQDDQTFSKSQFHRQTNEELPKVLGTAWDTEKDHLVFSFEGLTVYLEEKIITKRVVLSSIAKIFDPLGILSPIFTALKTMFQGLCKAQVDWDSPLDEDASSHWKALLKDMQKVSRFSIERCYLTKLNSFEECTIDLHGFGDGSDKAYGAVVYLRIVSGSSVECRIVASRTRVAPITGATTPRVELLSALVLARLIKSVYQALQPTLKISKTYCWLDSEIALWWIAGTGKEFKTFVQNRVREIRELAPPETWRHVPSLQNPADIASRGCKASELKKDKKWWEGPDFLKKEEESWPEQKNFGSLNMESSDVSEVKKISEVTINVAAASVERLENLIRPQDHSDFFKLLRITCYVLRFIKGARRQQPQPQGRSLDVELDELEEAENLWIRHVQKLVKAEDKYDQIRVSLGLFEDDKGVLRSGGRLQNAPLPYEGRFPAILPRKHHVTELIIKRHHSNVMHNGVKDTLTDLRSKFWIIKGRQAVRDVISRCATCKKFEGLAYSAPPQPPLPDFRVSDDFAFSRIGVDFAGPVYVRDVYSRSKRSSKAYIAIFTCASSRAIHLELVPDLSTSSFLRCFKRFIFRRGLPHFVISDNGKTFKGSSLKTFLMQHGVTWKFNVPRAPWWGGFFERMVRSVKRCLKKTLGTARVDYDEFETTLVEVEGILNSRPLTYVTEDIEEPLTPSSLCIGRRLLSPTRNPQVVSAQGNSATLSRRQRYLDTVLKHFWNRWRKEYLTELREHHRGKKTPQTRVIKKGDVVCVHEEFTPRQSWKIGLVQDLITGRDQVVRAAVVRVLSRGRGIEIKRPVQKLYPVEVPKDSGHDVADGRNARAKPEGPAIRFVSDDEVEVVRSS